MVHALVGNISTYKYREFMKPIFTRFSVCQGVQELLLLGKKGKLSGDEILNTKFKTSDGKDFHSSCLVGMCQCIEPVYLFLCGLGRFQKLKSGLRFSKLSRAMNPHFSVARLWGVVWYQHRSPVTPWEGVDEMIKEFPG